VFGLGGSRSDGVVNSVKHLAKILSLSFWSSSVWMAEGIIC
jgi:hypothetical protein